MIPIRKLYPLFKKYIRFGFKGLPALYFDRKCIITSVGYNGLNSDLLDFFTHYLGGDFLDASWASYDDALYVQERDFIKFILDKHNES